MKVPGSRRKSICHIHKEREAEEAVEHWKSSITVFYKVITIHSWVEEEPRNHLHSRHHLLRELRRGRRWRRWRGRRRGCKRISWLVDDLLVFCPSLYSHPFTIFLGQETSSLAVRWPGFRDQKSHLAARQVPTAWTFYDRYAVMSFQRDDLYS